MQETPNALGAPSIRLVVRTKVVIVIDRQAALTGLLLADETDSALSL